MVLYSSVSDLFSNQSHAMQWTTSGIAEDMQVIYDLRMSVEKL